MKEENIYQIIDFENSLGIKVFLHKVQHFPIHWHDCYEIIEVLENSCTVVIDGKENVLKKDDIILINSYSIHSITAKNSCVLLALQIDFSKLNEYYVPQKSFFLNSTIEKNKSYDYIKQILARMIKTYSENTKHFELLIQGLALNLYYELLTNFASPIDTTTNKVTVKKLSGVLEYIKNNYTQDLSLNSVAEKFSFAPSYLSRLFEKNMGQTYKKFVDEQRFAHAMSLLMTTDLSIDSVASQSGFANTRSFVAMHKQIYNTLPSESRKQNIKYDGYEAHNTLYQDFEKSSYLSEIIESVSAAESSYPSHLSASSTTFFSIDANNTIKKLRHTFLNFTSVGRASDILKKDTQEMLKTMQKEIGFKYIKFHGLFDDALSVYTISYNNREIYSFDYIDEIFDFLLSINLKPLVQLSFMPKDMAKYKDKTTFHMPLITSEPNDLESWRILINKFTKHLIDRYGKKEVESWLFSLWNEPETNTKMFGFIDFNSFYDFYKITFDEVKSIDENIQFGSPSIMTSTFLETDYMDRFLKAIHPRVPDFMHTNFYPMKKMNMLLTNAIESDTLYLDFDKDIMNKTIEQLNKKKDMIKQMTGRDIPFYITEWNATTSHRSIINDTAYKGSYVVRNLINNYDMQEGFAYWSMSDNISEVSDYPYLFHGGHGLFTKNGIKKPPYYAMYFLSKLYDYLIYKDDEIIATKNDEGDINIVTSNYIHINELFANGELTKLDNASRYNAFQKETTKGLNVLIDNLENGNYIIEEIYVNKGHGSAFDLWLKMFNGNEPKDSEAMELLKNSCTPGYKMRKISITENKFNYEVCLEPHEIRLIKITRVY